MLRRTDVIRAALAAACVLGLARTTFPEDAPPKVAVSVVTDRTDALYHVGEKAAFSIEVKREEQSGQEGAVTYALSLDGAGDLGRGTAKLENGKAAVSGSLDKPGILRCTVTFSPDGQQRVTAMAAAAFDPDKIQPTATVPADFEAFWDAQKAELAKVPVDAKLEPVTDANQSLEVFKITLANINGSRVHGYFAKPKGDGPFPAILTVPAAGVYSITPGWASGYAGQGFLAMGISAHDIEDGQPKEYYDKLIAGELSDYRSRGRDDRLTYYFRRVFLGCVRAVDYLTARPEWDKQHLIVNGSSQGGALSLITAGLDPRITALAANVPAMCDHSGLAFGRISGWPRLVPTSPDGVPDPKVLAVSAYYDAVNFARKTSVPAIVGVGLIDTTCPATTVFSAYNVLRGPKQIDIAPLMGHAQSQEYSKLKNRWVLEQAGLAK
jgi:cephalosporin-C deacetylase-like acetyl esterase